MNVPKFKSEEDEILWDCFFDLKLSKYHDCFDKVRKQFYNQIPNESGVETLRHITDTIISQASAELQNQKPEYKNVHS